MTCFRSFVIVKVISFCFEDVYASGKFLIVHYISLFFFNYSLVFYKQYWYVYSFRKMLKKHNNFVLIIIKKISYINSLRKSQQDIINGSVLVEIFVGTNNLPEVPCHVNQLCYFGLQRTSCNTRLYYLLNNSRPGSS